MLVKRQNNNKQSFSLIYIIYEYIYLQYKKCIKKTRNGTIVKPKDEFSANAIYGYFYIFGNISFSFQLITVYTFS